MHFSFLFAQTFLAQTHVKIRFKIDPIEIGETDIPDFTKLRVAAWKGFTQKSAHPYRYVSFFNKKSKITDLNPLFWLKFFHFEKR
ncbi:hypothetical protein LEP1GSC051_1806 [Leptospira sp. P2653]|nr:hypothetical protein LEP1GSC051_1806 [Leptospira sp. P2653]